MRNMEFIDVREQYRRYRSEIDRRMAAVFAHGQFVMGPEIEELEARLAAYAGTRHCLTVSSGTDSLEIALRALGIGPGDEVITVPFTWISTAEAVALVGARPVFVDVDPDTFNIDASRVEEAITERTRAIIPVDLFGQMADYGMLRPLAAKHGLTIIEDAAQSFGARQGGIPSCGVTDVGSTSFFPAKPLSCYGDGGALFTNDDGLAERMRDIRIHGGRRHHHTRVGMNGRFDTLQAAAMLAKLPHFDDELDARTRIGQRYSDALADRVKVPVVMESNTHVYAIYTIRTRSRDAMVEAMGRAGIPVAIYYPKCLHLQPVFASLGYQQGDFPEAERAASEVLSLPMHPFLEIRDQDRVIDAVREAVRWCA